MDEDSEDVILLEAAEEVSDGVTEKTSEDCAGRDWDCEAGAIATDEEAADVGFAAQAENNKRIKSSGKSRTERICRFILKITFLDFGCLHPRFSIQL